MESTRDGKINLETIDDFNHVMKTLRKGCDAIAKRKFNERNTNPRTQKRVQKRIHKFLKAIATTTGRNIKLLDGKDAELLHLDLDPEDAKLKEKIAALDKAKRNLIEEIIADRKEIPEKMVPMLKEAVQRKSSWAERVMFESVRNEEPVDLSSSTSPNLASIAKCYEDSMRLLANLEKTLPSVNAEYRHIRSYCIRKGNKT